MRTQILEVPVQLPLDGERREDVVVHERRAQVSQLPGRELLAVLVDVPSDHLVENRVAEELQSLVAVGD